MPVFQKDPCGVFCICMTYGAVLYADYVVVRSVNVHSAAFTGLEKDGGLMTGVFRWIVLQTMSGSLWGSFHVVMFNIVIFMLFMAHARAVLTGWQSREM